VELEIVRVLEEIKDTAVEIADGLEKAMGAPEGG
jgi:hypothetical protein